jgi:hypothetical protein
MNTLFSGTHLAEYLRECEKAAMIDVARLGIKDFAAKSANELAQDILASHFPQPLLIQHNEMSGILEQQDIEASRYPHHISRHQKKAEGKVLCLTVKIPFSGMQKLLELKPSFAQLHSEFPPGDIENNEIIIIFEDNHNSVEILDRRVREEVALLKQFADNLNEEMSHIDILPAVIQAIQDRKAELDQLQESVSKFSFPVNLAG